MLTKLLNSTKCFQERNSQKVSDKLFAWTSDRCEAEKGLRDFIKQAWHVLEPKTDFVPGWHIDAISDHLEAVTKGQIKRLLINIPPRCMKSLSVSVFWPCWSWINDPAVRWLFSSYAQDLSTRDSLKCRRLILSEWYQARWADRFYLVGDQNQKTRFENNYTGCRLSTSVDGVTVGEGGDNIVVDDAHNVKKVESDVIRKGVLTWYDEIMTTRLNDMKTGTITLVMQRSHHDDLAGHVLERDKDFVHLMLPAEYEPDRKCITDFGNKHFEDLRKEENELLWPEKMDRVVIEKQKRMGVYAYSGQYQQRPSPRGGGLFKVGKFNTIENLTGFNVVSWIRYWDKAGTQDGGAFTCGVKMGITHDKKIVIVDCVHRQWAKDIREAMIKLVAENDGKKVITYVEQAPGECGKESVEYTIKNLIGLRVKADRPTGNKEDRAMPYADQVEIGNVSILKASWTDDFIAEHEGFPKGKYKDMVDAGSGAFNKLTNMKFVRVPRRE